MPTATYNPTEQTRWGFRRFLGTLDLDTEVTVRLADGKAVVGTLKGYSAPFTAYAASHLAVVKAGARRATRVPFTAVREITGTPGASIADLLSEYVVAGDPAAGL